MGLTVGEIRHRKVWERYIKQTEEVLCASLICEDTVIWTKKVW